MFLHLGLFYIIASLANLQCSAAAATTRSPTWSPTPTPPPQLTSHRFQVKFLDALMAQVDTVALDYVDRFLQDLRTRPRYAKYSDNFEEILDTEAPGKNPNDPLEIDNKKSLDNKIVFIKQLLDVKSEEELEDEQVEHQHLGKQMENFYALRNVRFLKKLRHHLDEMQNEVGHEMRNVKMFELCRQFVSHEDEREKLRALERTIFAHIKMAPLAEQLLLRNGSRGSAASSASSTTNRIRFESLSQFGTLIYDRVKHAGSEIIDDYLTTIRKLLREFIAEKSEAGRRDERLMRVLHEIDVILTTDDFAKKRDRLYGYLQTNLANDYEQFKSSEYGQQDLAELLMKLKQRDLDMFVRFLFSNFEFLERMHAEWSALLHEMKTDDENNEHFKQLRQIHDLYEDFKQDPDKLEKYEAYVESVKRLHEQTKASGQDKSKAFEILHNSSQNVGSVTLNMIKAKCDEL